MKIMTKKEDSEKERGERKLCSEFSTHMQTLPASTATPSVIDN